MTTDAPRFEPLSFGALLDQTFRLYVKDFGALVGLAFLCNLPTMILEGFSLHMDVQERGLVGLGILPISLLTSSLLIGGLTLIISQRYLGEPIGLKTAIERTMSFVWRLLGTQILVGLWLTLGFLLLLIPGIIWSFTLALVVPVVVLEGLSGHPALARSKKLVSYNRSKVVGVVVLVGALVYCLMISFGSALGVVVVATGAKPEGNLLLALGPSLMGCLLAPVSYVANVLLYYDLRIRNEGFDLEMLSREMART